MNANAQTNEPNIVNGLNVDDLFSLIEGVKGDASKATTSWRVATTWQGRTRTRAEVEGFAIGFVREVRGAGGADAIRLF
jgi:hypothetical protein